MRGKDIERREGFSRRKRPSARNKEEDQTRNCRKLYQAFSAVATIGPIQGPSTNKEGRR